MKITIKEEMGFEPMRRFTDLTVFKTVPFSQTWVFFHNKNAFKRTTALLRRTFSPFG